MATAVSGRKLYLDEGFGERRGVVCLDGRPERLLIEREGDGPARLGARFVARLETLDRASGLAFLDLGEEPAVLNLGPETHGLAQGAALEVEIRAEARRGKAAIARLIGPADGPPRLAEPAPTIVERLQVFAGHAEVETGARARAIADAAQDAVLETIHTLPGGGRLAIEPTRALTAIDVDLGDRPGADTKRVARAANFAAIAEGARLLRLKGLGGLVAIDLVGRGHDAPALLSAARTAFAPDNPGVAIAPVSRFGVIELTIPRRQRGALETLTDEAGAVTPLTRALALVRALEREATADRGGRFEALAPPAVAELAGPALSGLIARVGARVSLRVEPTAGPDGVVRRA